MLWAFCLSKLWESTWYQQSQKRAFFVSRSSKLLFRYFSCVSNFWNTFGTCQGPTCLKSHKMNHTCNNLKIYRLHMHFVTQFEKNENERKVYVLYHFWNLNAQFRIRPLLWHFLEHAFTLSLLFTKSELLSWNLVFRTIFLSNKSLN